MKTRSLNKGFTLLEVLLVVGVIATLAGIVIVSINPAKQLADTRNAQRRSDVNTILNATYQYAIDNNGAMPNVVESTTCATAIGGEIWDSVAATTSPLTDLSVLISDQKYMTSMPKDSSATTTGGTGYHIVKSTNSRITICAPGAENDATISVTR